ncbi:acetyl-CoA carboxylase biotin carboxyl carrier protein [Paludicola sp. MB14-C6]|uniref:acetyl-CoA carboxylase biotin carboxyl carrier protein n=1 Tax=Paludihabitans sp. MB14-C6 TaxID=3070656 RepID=UPI0027DAC95A|nr:acetyl-CoA carboxylase biotin carboxyl carrier protein [Paludicola sp. MB14-C6]WMJ21872.1 acetyl-CoA carboxylase biotin carboxyl carrier protein [Paludicola sp. MB14-C6]
MLNFNEIKELMDKMQQTNLGELSIKDGDFELKLEAKKAPKVVSYADANDNIVETAQVAASSVAAPKVAETPVAQVSGNVVKSPIVGTFYAAAAPDKPAFVKVGSMVKKGDVLCVIESMKLMNEIQSDFDGEVVEIKVENSQGVEYGQPLMIIR